MCACVCGCPHLISVLSQVAENLVQRDGDFLIRDSLSSPGSYVLTSQWRNEAQHFKINKKVRGLCERIQLEISLVADKCHWPDCDYDYLIN